MINHSNIKDEDYFSLFDMNREYLLDSDFLEKRYFELQKEYHPDKFVGKNEGERLDGIKKSTLINDAYKALKSPLKRAEYILSLNGIVVNDEQNTIKPNQEILLEAMEQREALLNAEKEEELNEIDVSNKEKRDVCIKDLEKSFDNNELEKAAELAIKLRYIEKFAEEIKLKKSKIL